MRRKLSGVIAAIVIGAVVFGIGPTFHSDAGTGDVGPLESIPTSQAISMFQRRVELNGSDVVSATILGELFSRQARETGDVSKLEKAEAALDRALLSVPDYPRAQTALSSVYIAQHRFSEALVLARIANAADPDGGAIITIGDAQLALGRYQQARETFLTAMDHFSATVVSARLAHLDEIYGDLGGARLTMDKAAAAFLDAGGSGETAAWFQMRRGDLAFASGAYGDAIAAYEMSLEILPDYPASLAGLARSLEAIGDRAGAFAAYEKAMSVQPLPGILLALGELYELDGQTDKAREAFDTVGVVSDLSNGLFDLSLVFYEANHGSVSRAVETAEKLVSGRPDLFSYDALAWAQFQAGNLDAARLAADQALQTKPANAMLWYHSGAIWAGLGEEANALADLEMALSLSPAFDPVAVAEIAETMRALRP